MRPTEEELKHQIQEVVAQLRTLRDEVRVDLHLAGMEVRKRFAELEPQLHEIEHRGKEVTQASLQVVDEAVAKLRQLRDSITRGGPPIL